MIDFSSEGFGFIPEIGYGFDADFLSISLKAGYSFFNILDENNGNIFNGISIRMEGSLKPIRL